MARNNKTNVFFFSIWVFFHEHSRFTGQQGKGEAISLTPLCHFHPYHRHLDISQAIIKALEKIGENLVNWFPNNEMKLNTDKRHLLLNSKEPNTFKIDDLHINNSLTEKLLGITFDFKLKFNKYMEDI